MRPIYLARMEKTRPVLVLTRERIRPHLAWVTIAPITSTIRGVHTEVAVGPANGIDHAAVINCDNITTIPVPALGRFVGYLLHAQEQDLTEAILAAFDLA